MTKLLQLTNKLFTDKSIQALKQTCTELAEEPANDHVKDIICEESRLARLIHNSKFKGDSNIIDLIYHYGEFGSESTDPLNQYFANLSLAKGVNYRAELINSVLMSMENKKVASIACGSGKEIPSISTNEYHCFDSDPNAIYKLELRDKQNVKTYCQNVITSPIGKDYDFIYSAGLFDYFNNRLSRRVIKKLLASLKVGGKLLVANADKDAPDQKQMNNLLDWELIYKSKEELASIVGGLEVDFDIIQDEFGAFNYMTIIKK